MENNLPLLKFPIISVDTLNGPVNGIAGPWYTLMFFSIPFGTETLKEMGEYCQSLGGFLDWTNFYFKSEQDRCAFLLTWSHHWQ